MLFALGDRLAFGLALAFVSATLLWFASQVDNVPAFRPRAAFALGFGGALAGLASHLFADLLMIPIADNPVEPLAVATVEARCPARAEQGAREPEKRTTP
ncbi:MULTISPECIES: hypothetical protein [Halorussus]|uniref:hypothetical protein n=1 Tax=Halorussus TaxID=1070314 RepID=UPI000E20F530|nr:MULTISPECIES: hypothetical protein [Halorussus]NHN58473.1 hypothetical protein [Halorussus sp. JP-T4]